MIRNPNNDSAIGKIITDWLSKNNHSQAWLATKADITSIHMNRVIKVAINLLRRYQKLFILMLMYCLSNKKVGEI